MDDQAEREAVLAEHSRRAFLRRAAAGTGAFLVPTILTIDTAGAQDITSPPPEPPSTPPTDVGGSTISRSPDRPPAGPQVAGRTTLPRTGAELDDLFVAGLAATAGGAALLLWSADADRSR